MVEPIIAVQVVHQPQLLCRLFFQDDWGFCEILPVLLMDIRWDSLLVEFVVVRVLVVLEDQVLAEHGEGDELPGGREGDLLEDVEEVGGEGERGGGCGEEEVGELDHVEFPGTPEFLEVGQRALLGDCGDSLFHTNYL